MKKTGLLNTELNRVISSLAHTDQFLVCDSGFPIPPGVPIVDLRVIYGLPEFAQVLKAIVAEVEVEASVAASEVMVANPETHELLTNMFESLIYEPHEVLKKRALAARFAVRTAELRPYSNVLLTAGWIG